jgi:hypothetical protein
LCDFTQVPAPLWMLKGLIRWAHQFIKVCLVLFFVSNGVWTEGFALGRLLPYHLSHTSLSVCSGYYENKVLLLSQVGLDQDCPILGFLLSLGWQDHIPAPSYVLKRDLMKFLLRLASNRDPPNLSFSSS